MSKKQPKKQAEPEKPWFLVFDTRQPDRRGFPGTVLDGAKLVQADNLKEAAKKHIVDQKFGVFAVALAGPVQWFRVSPTLDEPIIVDDLA